MEDSHQSSIRAQARMTLEAIHEQTDFKVETVLVGKMRLSILTFNEVSSTMNISEAWPVDLLTERECYAFVARQQSHGQTQTAGSVWLSPPGNIYVTLLIRLSQSDLPGLSIVSSLAVCDLFENLNIKDAKLKWINDVIVGGKKVSGNLVRTSNAPDGTFTVQIGLGANVMSAPLEDSTCLNDILPASYNLAELTHELLKLLLRNIDSVVKDGLSGFTEEVQKRMLYLGQDVYIYDKTLTKLQAEGVFKRLGEEFQAELQTQHGPLKVVSGRMRNTKL